LKIHEYQAKEILAKYGVAVPKGEMANTLEEAIEVTRKLFAEGASGVVVKAQIHAGGRGKGGGVKVAKTREDAELHAKNSGHATGDAPDRPAGTEGAAAAGRRDGGHRPRALPGHRARPRHGQAGVHGLAGRRHGD
jgi:hypothetical protein